MVFPDKSTRAPTLETIFSSLALDLKSQESREDSVRKDLMHRLKRVCENLSSADFEALVLKMTREQLRGEGSVHGRNPPC
jgi:hypothetical protein